jgi:hypothetical protein
MVWQIGTNISGEYAAFISGEQNGGSKLPKILHNHG